MTNLMTDRMTSWIILWLIQMVKSGKFHTCNVFFKVLFLKHFAIHFRSAFARMKRRRYNCEIYWNIDWYWQCWLKSISLLLLNWWWHISAWLHSLLDLTDLGARIRFWEFPGLASGLSQAAEEDNFSLNIDYYALFRMKTTGPTVLTEAFLKKSQNGLQLLECLNHKNMDKP